VGYLVILRGPAGSGKDTIGKRLVEKLGGNTQACMLDLDITGPLEGHFLNKLEQSLRYEHVIGMLFWGDKHTENPESWIVKFKDRNYTIISVILHASLQTLIHRVEKRGHDCKSPVEMKQYFKDFNRIKNIFVCKAQVREISIDTEGKKPDAVADEILSNLMGS
jgi:deoxyadenosine/deoxycytidine kinase